MALSPVEHSIRAEVVFAGFTSDTYTLFRHGWVIAVQDDNYGETSTMVLKNEALGAVAYARCMDYRRTLAHSRHSLFQQEYMLNHHPLTYRVEQMGKGVVMRGVNIVSNMEGFSIIDPTPKMLMVEEYDLFNLPAFAKMNAPTPAEELIVDPKDVSAMLDMIRNAQSPKQADIRERARRREVVPLQHATIFTFPLAA